MKTVCENGKCTGCMACVDICPNGAIEIKDEMFVYNAVLQEHKCINCNACIQTCQNNHPVELLSPFSWYQGWAEDDVLRKKSSSGGLATAISKGVIASGGVVYSCTFKDGEFVFEVAETEEELSKFMGSKYVKSNPVGVYKKIKERIKSGQRVLFIGLPCQVAAVRNFLGESLEKKFYSIDLICHGTPSPKVLDIFLKQYGYSLSGLKNIQFRIKAKFMVYGDYKGIITNGVNDRYSIAFLNSLIYTDNCYNCRYARKERVADITLGDSWGTSLPIEEQKKGISLVLCQTVKGEELLKCAAVHMESVEIENAIECNHQLKHPSIQPSGREKFFKQLKDKKFNSLVMRRFPKQCLRQDIKRILIKAKLLEGGRRLKYSILINDGE